MSASQICMASSAALPFGARPPVSAMPKPMVIGFCAWAGVLLQPSPTNARAAAAARIRRLGSIRFSSRLIGCLHPMARNEDAPGGLRRHSTLWRVLQPLVEKCVHALVAVVRGRVVVPHSVSDERRRGLLRIVE